ncbi:MAG: hypothetical protein GF331_17380 [Chitinivibrionales bacterium]|nr:hypothetical protein [Chitinivibrionales bacterium]
MTNALERVRQDTDALLSLAEADRRSAVEVFSRLSMDEQQAMIASVPGEGKKELLFLERDCTQLAQSLPVQEIHKAIEAATASESDVLLEIVSPEQLVFMIDVQCWRGDEIDSSAFLTWLDRLNAGSDSVAAETVARADTDFLARALRPLVVAHNISRDEIQLSLDMGSPYTFSPDDIEWADQSATEFFERLYSLNARAFDELCMKLTYDSPEQIDFAAYTAHRLRRRRAGAPDTHDTAGLYAGPQPSVSMSTPIESSSRAIAPLAGQELFVEQVLAYAHEHLEGAVDPVQLARAIDDLLARVTIVDGRGLSAHDRRITTRKASVYVSLGLEYRSHGVVAFAARLLQSFEPSELYRDGYAVVRAVHAKVAKLRRVGGKHGELEHCHEAVLLDAAREIPRRAGSGGTSHEVVSVREMGQLLGELGEIERAIRMKRAGV